MKALASEVGATHAALSHYEAGIYPPSAEQIAKIAESLRFSTRFFYGEGDIYPAISYTRKKSALGAKDRDRIDHTLNIIRWLVRSMIEHLSVPSLSLPEFSPTRPQTPETASDALRSFWQLPRGPIKNLTNIIERAGIIVFPFDFGSVHIDALTITAIDTPPIIFISSTISSDRYRFTLAHELGHLCLHKNLPNENMENEADRFAGAFLLPNLDARIELTNLTIAKLGVLKLRWKMSMAALIMRARNAGTITEKWTTYLMTEFSRRGWRMREPIDLPFESSRYLSRAFESLQHDMGIALSDLLDEAGVLEDDFRTWFSYISVHPQDSAKVYHL